MLYQAELTAHRVRRSRGEEWKARTIRKSLATDNCGQVTYTAGSVMPAVSKPDTRIRQESHTPQARPSSSAW